MSQPLMQRFLLDELDHYVSRRIEEFVATGSGRQYLTLNVFNVSIDLDTEIVILEDALDPSSEETLKLNSFLKQIRKDNKSKTFPQV